MRYLHRQARRRKDPRLIVPESLSVVMVLDNYYTPDTATDLAAPRVAKYARGQDYHRVTLERLDRLADWLRARGAAVARPYVDAGPVPERELAQRAGLGWIGKNTMLIRPGTGSFCFIGAVFTDLPLPLDRPFEADHCGSCTRCLDACPTGALIEPRVLDATRCISYLTIEQRGPIPDELTDRLSGYAFGCDVCNDVCPWNQRFAEPTTVPQLAARRPLAGVDQDTFERMDEAEFAERFGATPFARPGLAGMRRNVRAALASTEGERVRP
jgi:epoxyqueuosine reductase